MTSRPMMSRRRALPFLGVGLLWLFLALFLVYPLLRIFYDAVTDEGGRLTLVNFAAFFTDAFYLRALWKSLVLGAATVAASSVIGIAVAFLLVRFDFPGRSLFGYLTMIPIISPPLVAPSASSSSSVAQAPSTCSSRTSSISSGPSTSSTASTASSSWRRSISFP